MLQDVIRQPEMLPVDDISSQISAQIFEFCDHELFPETLQNSDEVTSCSNCCYEENSSYAPNFSLPQDVEKFTSYLDNNGNTDTTMAGPIPTATSTPTNTTNNNTNNSNNISIIFDSQEEMDNDISASIDFSPSPSFSVPPLILGNQQDQFDFSSVQPQISLADSVVDGFSQYLVDPVGHLMPASLPSVLEEDCLSSVPPYVPLNPSSPSCSFLGPAINTYLPAGTMNTAALSVDSSGIFNSSILMASDLQPQELDYQGDTGGIYCTDTMQRVFKPGELQGFSEVHTKNEKALGNESQQLMGGAGNSTSLATDIPNMGDQTFKVGKLSVEQRKEKIHRYMKKRNERNFSKKIKYACRKTLADSRPRVRGRFAKNDDFGETPRTVSSNHEDDDDEEVVVKEEDDMVDSSDIFAHISGVNSFKCNYSHPILDLI
ncbi:CCT domain containing protein [Parasponia andersonii]|uniref:CCT domain containing protein n=1 Tax=Parasponia andersonii TaxID=3476 RepID=A0A2P5ANM3_PARAD|nr:CCT domain containing protein [Parasponia andersonii]